VTLEPLGPERHGPGLCKPLANAPEETSIVFSADLQRTAPATEAIFLMIANVFDIGYRRCEWNCDALDEP